MRHARTAARLGAAALLAGVAIFAGVMAVVMHPRDHTVYAAGAAWGTLHIPYIVLAANALAAAALAAGVLSDMVSTQRDAGFWGMCFFAMWGTLSSLLVWGNVAGVVGAFVGGFAVAALFALALGVAEGVWDSEASARRGALGWASTPAAHTVWAAVWVAMLAAGCALFMDVVAVVYARVPWPERATLPALAIVWPPVVVAHVFLANAFYTVYAPGHSRARVVRTVGVAGVFAAFSVATVLFETVA